MLRLVVAALLVANIVFFTWSQGWLDGLVGARSIGDREPDRMSRQVRPELVRILPAAAASEPAGAADAASAPVVTAPEPALACLEAGPFGDPALAAAQSAAREALPGASLTVVKTTQPGTWIVYMGRYADREALQKKEAELKRRKLNYEEMINNSLAPGLSLGRFDDRTAAGKALEQYALQGIRTARIVELIPAATIQTLRIEKADPILVAQAIGLRTAALGKGFAVCAKPN